MPKDEERRDEEERRRRRDLAARGRLPGFALRLHCSNPFPVTEGVVTADAALCDVCNGS